MKIRVTRVYEKELQEFEYVDPDTFEKSKWIDESYTHIDQDSYAGDKFKDTGMEPPKFPVTDPKDAVNIDKFDLGDGVTFDEMGYEEVRETWELIADDGLPISNKPPMDLYPINEPPSFIDIIRDV